MEQLSAAVFLAVINTKLIDALKAPIEKRYPDWDLWFVIYVAFASGVGLAWLAQINVFAAVIPHEVAGTLLTGLFVGGGSSLIYDVFSDKPASSIKVEATRQEEGGDSLTQVSVREGDGES